MAKQRIAERQRPACDWQLFCSVTNVNDIVTHNHAEPVMIKATKLHAVSPYAAAGYLPLLDATGPKQTIVSGKSDEFSGATRRRRAGRRSAVRGIGLVPPGEPLQRLVVYYRFGAMKCFFLCENCGSGNPS